MEKAHLNKHSFFLIYFLTFIGYYAILLTLFNIGLSEATRSVTVPIRLLIMCLLVLLIWVNKENLQKISVLGWFALFVYIYLARLFIEYIVGSYYYMPITEVALYFIGFCVFPFLGIITQKLNEEILKTIFKTFLFGGLIFSVLSIIFYKQFIGEVGRLASNTAGEAIISPLALSYSSALTIGVIGFYMLGNKTSKNQRLLMLGVIGASVIPFFLGASRGSLVALAIPFIVYFLSGRTVKFFLKSIILIVISISLFVYLDGFLKSGLLDRFLGISAAIESGSSSAIRTVIWKNSFSQFIDNPIIGGSLKVKGYNRYPHNIFLDVLQATGIIGFVPFIILVFKAWKASFNIFRKHKELMWIAVVFIQAFMQHMFSGAIYMAAWFWTSIGLVLATEYYLKNKNKGKIIYININ